MIFHCYVGLPEGRYIKSGWWLTNPSEKYMFVSWDDEIPNIWKNKNHVPNHQPVNYYVNSVTPYNRQLTRVLNTAEFKLSQHFTSFNQLPRLYNDLLHVGLPSTLQEIKKMKILLLITAHDSSVFKISFSTWIDGHEVVDISHVWIEKTPQVFTKQGLIF